MLELSSFIVVRSESENQNVLRPIMRFKKVCGRLNGFYDDGSSPAVMIQHFIYE